MTGRPGLTITLFAVLALAGIAACAPSPDPPSPSDESSGVEELACSVAGHPRFPASFMEGPQMDRAAFAKTPSGQALEAFFRSPDGAPEAEMYRGADGFAMVDDAFVLAYRDGAPFADFHLDDGRVEGWGDCRPNRVDGELVAARWRPSGRLDTDADSLAIEVEGGTCGGDTKTEVVRVDVLEDETSVAILAWTRDPEPTGGVCAGVGILVNAVADLTAPLGDRTLVDAGIQPATVVET